MSGCTTTQAHCESCGSTDSENLGDDGYTTCCGERVTHQAHCRDQHGQDRLFQTRLDAAAEDLGYDDREQWMAADFDSFEATSNQIESEVYAR